MKKFYAVLALALLISCNSTTNSDDSAVTGGSYTQIERLARPAINEGLIFTHSYNAAFNAIAPSVDTTAAASAVVAEAAAVLGLVNTLGVAVHTALFSTHAEYAPASVGAVAGGFLPDVLRIDTRNDFTITDPAYNGSFELVGGANPILTGGRKITDDVMDVTLSYLLEGAIAAGVPNSGAPLFTPKPGFNQFLAFPTTTPLLGDGVTYNGATQSATSGGGDLGAADCTANVYKDAAVLAVPSQPGHACLVGQTVRNDAANTANAYAFPFIPPPWTDEL